MFICRSILSKYLKKIFHHVILAFLLGLFYYVTQLTWFLKQCSVALYPIRYLKEYKRKEIWKRILLFVHTFCSDYFPNHFPFLLLFNCVCVCTTSSQHIYGVNSYVFISDVLVYASAATTVAQTKTFLLNVSIVLTIQYYLIKKFSSNW